MGYQFGIAKKRNKMCILLPSVDSSVSVCKRLVLERLDNLSNKITSYPSILCFAVKFLPKFTFNRILSRFIVSSPLPSTFELPQTRLIRPTFRSCRLASLSEKNYTLIPKIKKPTFKISKDGR